jgi:hypothetical protein
MSEPDPKRRRIDGDGKAGAFAALPEEEAFQNVIVRLPALHVLHCCASFLLFHVARLLVYADVVQVSRIESLVHQFESGIPASRQLDAVLAGLRQASKAARHLPAPPTSRLSALPLPLRSTVVQFLAPVEHIAAACSAARCTLRPYRRRRGPSGSC